MHGMYGTLDESEVQRTIKRAKLTAFLLHLTKAIGPTMVHVDNKGIIFSRNKNNDAESSNLSEPRAGPWHCNETLFRKQSDGSVGATSESDVGFDKPKRTAAGIDTSSLSSKEVHLKPEHGRDKPGCGAYLTGCSIITKGEALDEGRDNLSSEGSEDSRRYRKMRLLQQLLLLPKLESSAENLDPCRRREGCQFEAPNFQKLKLDTGNLLDGPRSGHSAAAWSGALRLQSAVREACGGTFAAAAEDPT